MASPTLVAVSLPPAASSFVMLYVGPVNVPLAPTVALPPSAVANSPFAVYNWLPVTASVDVAVIAPLPILDNVVPVVPAAMVVDPSGFTSRACGVVTSTAPAIFVPSALTLPAGYHFPSVAFTTRLPAASVYTTVPASPLRNAFTLVVTSLLFKPSSFVRPVLAIDPASVPTLPSRPSAMVLPSFAASLMIFRVAASKPMFTTPFSAVEIAIPCFTVSALVVAASAPVDPTVPVPDLKCNPSPTATSFLASSPALYPNFVGIPVILTFSSVFVAPFPSTICNVIAPVFASKEPDVIWRSAVLSNLSARWETFAFSANFLDNCPPVTASVESSAILPSANPVILEPLTSILPLAVADVPLFTVILA